MIQVFDHCEFSATKLNEHKLHGEHHIGYCKIHPQMYAVLRLTVFMSKPRNTLRIKCDFIRFIVNVDSEQAPGSAQAS